VEPVLATAPEGDERLFVVERRGRILIVQDGEIRRTPFLDIGFEVGTDGEGGVLGLAFDPEHAFNGRFYVYYTDRSGDSVVSRFTAGADPNEADLFSEEILLVVPQPDDNHNGATIAFSPIDGHLYVGLGDGGGQDDPQERAQDGGQLLGKMLRLRVDGSGTPYRIPSDNPFRSQGGTLEEIWAFGLRNPYRFSFDWLTGDLWIADVGQDQREEINFEPAGRGGRNYGWDVMEGTLCNPNDPAPSPSCNDPSLSLPLWEYEHADGNCSVTGGAVYRGPIAALDGLYFFADYCSGRIWSLDPSDPTDVIDWTAQLFPAAGASFEIAALSEGGFGALHAVHMDAGAVYRIGPTGDECRNGQDDDGDGRTDTNDPGCRNANDPSERDPSNQCDDGFDNDRNGRIDYQDDSGCTTRTDPIEAPPVQAAGGGSSGGGGGGDDGGGGGGCGIGFELVFVLPPLIGWYRRRRR
jgi:hypothetical protein